MLAAVLRDYFVSEKSCQMLMPVLERVTMKLKLFLAATAIILEIISAVPAVAAPQNYAFSGKITGYTDPTNVLALRNIVGQDFRGSAFFDKHDMSFHFPSPDGIGPISVGKTILTLDTPNDGALFLGSRSNGIFFAVLPYTTFVFHTADKTPTCVGDGGLTISGNSVLFDLSCRYDKYGPGNVALNLSLQGMGSFDMSAAVPEPAFWSLMILGFGVIGVAIRHQRKANQKGNYA